MGTLISWNPLGHSGPVMGLIYLYLLQQFQYNEPLHCPKETLTISLHFFSLILSTLHFTSRHFLSPSLPPTGLTSPKGRRQGERGKTKYSDTIWSGKTPRRPHIKNRDIRTFFVSLITDCHPVTRPIPSATSSQGICGYIAVMATLKFTGCCIGYVIPVVFIIKLDWSVCTV